MAAHSASLRRRDFLKCTLAGMAGAGARLGVPSVLGQSPSAAAARPGHTSWGINTNIDRCQAYASSTREAIARVGPLVEELGCRLVREGVMFSEM